MKIDVHIPFFILSKNQNNNRYTAPSSIHFSSCNVNKT